MPIKGSLLNRGTGFALPELLVVLALLALMSGLTVPTMRHWFLRDRVDQAARSLLTTFDYARSEAIRRGNRVSVCRANGLTQCAKTSSKCGTGALARADNWACGWLVTVDLNAESFGPFPLPSQPQSEATRLHVLRRYPTRTGLSIISPAAALSFTPPAGQVIGNFRSFEIAASPSTLNSGAAQLIRCIRIAAGGRTRLSDGACARMS